MSIISRLTVSYTPKWMAVDKNEPIDAAIYPPYKPRVPSSRSIRMYDCGRLSYFGAILLYVEEVSWPCLKELGYGQKAYHARLYSVQTVHYSIGKEARDSSRKYCRVEISVLAFSH